ADARPGARDPCPLEGRRRHPGAARRGIRRPSQAPAAHRPRARLEGGGMSARMIHGDARHLPLDDESVDCIVTSPPYNVGMPYEGVDDTRDTGEYTADVRAWTREMFRVLRDNRRVWVNVVPAATQDDHERPAGWHSGRTKAPRLPLLTLWANALEKAGFSLIDFVAWTRIGNNSTAWGSYQSPASPNLRGDWEVVILACKGEYARPT